MENTISGVRRTVQIIGILICILSIAVSAFIIVDGLKETADETPYAVLILANISVLGIGLAYFLGGFSKKDAEWFRFFMIAFAGCQLLNFVLSFFITEVSVLTTEFFVGSVVTLLCYGHCLILAEAKDLGKVWSFILMGFVALAYLCFAFSTSGLLGFATAGMRFIMAVIGLIMIFAKYVDKKERYENK